MCRDKISYELGRWGRWGELSVSANCASFSEFYIKCLRAFIPRQKHLLSTSMHYQSKLHRDWSWNVVIA